MQLGGNVISYALPTNDKYYEESSVFRTTSYFQL